MNDLEQHPLSACFPAMRDYEFAWLCESIAADGLHRPITLYQGQVLDGWHRYKACQQTGVQPRFETFEGDAKQAMCFLISSNVKRQHLNESQRAMIAARLATPA
jgi:hypothetical protein